MFKGRTYFNIVSRVHDFKSPVMTAVLKTEQKFKEKEFYKPENSSVKIETEKTGRKPVINLFYLKTLN